MCKETLEMMLCLNRKELETQVVMQCAPLLTGIKISNLLTTDQNNRIHTARLFSRTPVSCFLLCQSQGKAVFLLYMKEQLKAYLDLPSVKGLMKRFGYTGMKLDEILSLVGQCYKDHMEGRREFPHEIGLLLGYPAADVEGFIENKGQDSLYSGYWKVYSDPEECRRIFNKYDHARERVIRLMVGGMTVRHIIALHHPYYYSTAAV